MKALIAKTSILSAVIMIMILVGLPLLSSAANDQRQAEVVERGKDIMPFNLKATTHVFTKPQRAVFSGSWSKTCPT